MGDNLFKEKKFIFLEALLLTLLIFFTGLLIGVLFEQHRIDLIDEYYTRSEINMMDVLALNNLANLKNSECDVLINSNLKLADKIYNESKILDTYENAGRIKNEISLEHKKYDVMRAFLWINTMKADEICKNNIHTIVYLYSYHTEDLTEKATNSVWAKVLDELKQKQGNNILLIPIAVDANVSSLDAVLLNYNIQAYPAIIIDNKQVVQNLTSVEQIESYLHN